MKKLLASGMGLLVLALSPLIMVSGVGYAYDCPSSMDPIQCGVCQTDNNAPGCGGTAPTAEKQVNDFVALIINIFSWLVGVISVLMIMVGGFKYITANGDSGKVGSAKNTILYAIIGLVIVALAQVIVTFVLGAVT